MPTEIRLQVEHIRPEARIDKSCNGVNILGEGRCVDRTSAKATVSNPYTDTLSKTFSKELELAVMWHRRFS